MMFVPLSMPLKECVMGRVYRLHSRNLAFGVFDGYDGFIGIRTKFGERFLDREYSGERGSQFGTVTVLADLGIAIPPEINIAVGLGTIDTTTKRPLTMDKDIENPNFPGENKLGWWRYADTGEVAPTTKNGCRATSVPNDALFEFLEKIEKSATGS
jgi:hypothetical protein